MDLKESARQWVLRHLPYDRSDATLATQLKGLSAGDLLMKYHNWMSRLIKPVPRVVHKSSAFANNLLRSPQAADIGTILTDISSGHNLTKYLSRDVVVGAQDETKTGRRRDLDLMLNAWRVHHLHTSTTLEADGFAKRGNTLLFSVFREDACYMIDIMTHQDWSRDHVLEVMIDEWPKEELVYEVKGVIGPGQTLTEEMRKTLRGKHVNSQFFYKGKVYMPTGILSAAGTSFDSIREADKVVILLDNFESIVKSDPDFLAEQFASQGATLPADPKFEFEIREHGFGVLEERSSTWITLN